MRDVESHSCLIPNLGKIISDQERIEKGDKHLSSQIK